jgi:hypothetical protein
MATNRPTIDFQGYKSREGLIIEAVCDRSLEYELITSSSSRKILRSLGQMKNQKKLLIHVT